MPDHDDLIARLRRKRMRQHDLGGVTYCDDPDCAEAADALAEAQAQLRQMREERDEAKAREREHLLTQLRSVQRRLVFQRARLRELESLCDARQRVIDMLLAENKAHRAAGYREALEAAAKVAIENVPLRSIAGLSGPEEDAWEAGQYAAQEDIAAAIRALPVPGATT
jgi:chromosome segregation ATPase